MRFLAAILLIAVVMLAGCVSQPSKIASERRQYLADPAIPHLTYDGKLTKSGAHYLYLYQHDPGFGDFLLSVVPTAKDPRVIVAALTFFGSKSLDPVKFEKVIAATDPLLLDQEVDLTYTDVLAKGPLREWIENTRKLANQPPQPTRG